MFEEMSDEEIAALVAKMGPTHDPLRSEVAQRLRSLSRQVNDSERTLQRYDACIDVITQLVWPACTDAQADAPEYLMKLVTKVGALARLTANDSQAWDTAQKHIVSNGKLAKRVCQLNERVRHLEAERTELAARVTDLGDDLEMATAAYGALRTRLMLPVVESFDANGAPC